MLPPSHQQRYREFKHVLEQVRGIAEPGVAETRLKSEFSELQQFFQGQILSLAGSDLTPAVEQRVQSYQVEMNKQLRLLGIDVMFLQAAKQATTRAQRWGQVGDRLTTLIRYCEILLEEEEGGEGGGS